MKFRRVHSGVAEKVFCIVKNAHPELTVRIGEVAYFKFDDDALLGIDVSRPAAAPEVRQFAGVGVNNPIQVGAYGLVQVYGFGSALVSAFSTTYANSSLNTAFMRWGVDCFQSVWTTDADTVLSTTAISIMGAGANYIRPLATHLIGDTAGGDSTIGYLSVFIRAL